MPALSLFNITFMLSQALASSSRAYPARVLQRFDFHITLSHHFAINYHCWSSLSRLALLIISIPEVL